MIRFPAKQSTVFLKIEFHFIRGNKTKVGFSYENSASLQTDDAGHVGAAVLVHVVCVVGLYTNDVSRN